MRIKPKSSRQIPWLWIFAASLIIALIIAFSVRHFVAAPFNVSSGSMEPTLRTGEVVLVDRKTAGQAVRGQVVVFDGTGYFAPVNGGEDKYWVKRIIGVGGDQVECCNDQGQLLANGIPLEEPYLAVEPSAENPASDTQFFIEVPAGKIFVMGDNRANSTDSRSYLGSPGGGMIPQERIQGHVSRILWPLSAWRALPQ